MMYDMRAWVWKMGYKKDFNHSCNFIVGLQCNKRLGVMEKVTQEKKIKVIAVHEEYMMLSVSLVIREMN